MLRFAILAAVLFAAPVRADDSAAVLKAQLEARQAQVKVAEANLALAKTSLQRIEELSTKGIVSPADYEKAKIEVELAAAQLAVKQAEVREAAVRIKAAREPEAKAAVGAKVAVFNMAAVMRDFEKAKYQEHLLGVRRNDLAAPLHKKREELIALQKDIGEETDLKKREKQIGEFQALQQKFAAEEAEINKKLGEDAAKAVSGLYDDIKTVVDAIAKAEGWSLVLAYPDAVNDAEKASPYLKELKLRTTAAQPFFVAKELDITAAVLKKLNADHPAVDKDGKKVDVSKLPMIPAVPMKPGPKP